MLCWILGWRHWQAVIISSDSWFDANYRFRNQHIYIYIYCTSLKNAWGILQRSKQITSGCNLPVTSAAALQSSTRVSRKAALLTWNARIRFSELCDYFQVRVKVFYRIQPSAYVVHYVESKRSKNKQPRTRAGNRKPYAIGLMKKTVYHSYAKILFNYTIQTLP